MFARRSQAPPLTSSNLEIAAKCGRRSWPAGRRSRHLNAPVVHPSHSEETTSVHVLDYYSCRALPNPMNMGSGNVQPTTQLPCKMQTSKPDVVSCNPKHNPKSENPTSNTLNLKIATLNRQSPSPNPQIQSQPLGSNKNNL